MGPGVQWDSVTENRVVPVRRIMCKYTTIPSLPGPIEPTYTSTPRWTGWTDERKKWEESEREAKKERDGVCTAREREGVRVDIQDSLHSVVDVKVRKLCLHC